MSSEFNDLIARLRDVATLSSVGGLLSWDQETMMPPDSTPARAEALALIGSLAHERATAPEVGELLDRCEGDASLGADPATAADLREIRRDYDRARKLPTGLVAEMTHTAALAIEAWKSARDDSDFETFRPWLEKQVELSRTKAECYGTPPDSELYDALLDDYEPGMTAAALTRIFDPLREQLTPLIAEIASASTAPSLASQELKLPLDLQREFHRTVLSLIGFTDSAGRLDTSVHPFSSGIAPGDTRMTTRYQPDQFAESLGSTMHEAGHALYEQGLPKAEHWGQPRSQPVGLGIHESQSRLWENHIGRSREFWSWALPLAQKIFRPRLDAFGTDDLYRAVNCVRPSLIRVESDEATYNLHVMLRFDLERALLRDDLKVADLPEAWNERMRRDLGLEVPDDAHGCLQDIHWSLGSIGYFPTYTLGTLYAAQFHETLTEALPGVEQQIAAGEFSGLLGWLREKIHSQGRRYGAEDLCREVTGKSLSHDPLMRHLRRKLEPIYGLGTG